MSGIIYVVGIAVIGLVVGGLARLVLPGKDEMGLLATFMLGITGSFVGGLIAWLIFGDTNGVGIIGGVVAAALLLYVVRKLDGGGLLDPGDAD